MIAELHPTFPEERAPIFEQVAAVVDLHTRRPVLRLVTNERVPVRRPTPTRLAILNDGTGVSGAILWSV